MTSPVDKFVVRRNSGLYGYERALARAGLAPVAGADEAGRGACAGPLVAGAAILSDAKSRQIRGLADSKLLSAAQREHCYDQIMDKALSWAVVSVPPQECDQLGMHVANISALRRALLRLDLAPVYVLTDGFGVDGLGVPGLAVWKGDRVAACVAAASILAKVTRDKMMVEEAERWPDYAFEIHKGYCTPLHQERLDAVGPCPIHRRRFENVRDAEARRAGTGEARRAGTGEARRAGASAASSVSLVLRTHYHR
ncbi:MAG: ribonuclease HII [Propionibacteriaceae bacterium]